MAPMKTGPTAGGVDLSLVMDEIYLSQNFELWFGKTIFEGILAEIIQEERSRHRAITLVNVLELMVAIYCSDATGNYREQITPQETYEAFYRCIHDRRSDTSDDDWEAFRRRLSFDIATSCKKLREEKIPELHGISLSTPFKTPMVPTPTIDASNGASSCSSFSSSSTPSPVSSHQQHSAESLSETNGIAQNRPALQPLANPAPASRASVDMHRYTSVLNEHATLQGERLTYKKEQLSFSPSSWQCTAIFGQISGVGTGRNSTQAKHEASKQICKLIDLMVL